MRSSTKLIDLEPRKSIDDTRDDNAQFAFSTSR